MDEEDLRRAIVEKVAPRAARFGIDRRELTDGFDLVTTGVLNSMDFVEMVVSLEREFAVELDYEKAFQTSGFTSIGGVVTVFMEQGER